MKKILIFIILTLPSFIGFSQLGLTLSEYQIYEIAILNNKPYNISGIYNNIKHITLYNTKYSYCTYWLENDICFREMFVTVDSLTHYVKSINLVDNISNEIITFSSYNFRSGEIENKYYILCYPYTVKEYINYIIGYNYFTDLPYTDTILIKNFKSNKLQRYITYNYPLIPRVNSSYNVNF